MRVDHVSYAAEKDGLKATAERLAKKLAVTPVDGGIHPRFGTRNIILPLAHERFVEVVAVLDHPASDKAPFGQAVRARSEAGRGRQPAPPRWRRAQVASAWCQGTHLRPTAALLHPVGRQERSPLGRGHH